ncbi:envelope stress response membrane protein PspB [Wenzhouxiangella sp. AB-CW3]|uniref:envelope stress response membrane protein PspB n=1 Tax=Wenzhouxiangella sp. AB-CW3 TaxID=2771012 RepID=UPI00168A6D91|nr:envelope stress response membrane protein PspB [Wenzhouxiangella sp. AB-CW3]QOC23606.1 envelope stress response membrane protein PspB [Wenzhouxiangella sp. AB-CW3]
MWFDSLFPLLVIFLIIVAPIWLILHYATRNSANRRLNSKDEAMLEELIESAQRMEDRIRTLERILDADTPEWRNRT